MAETRRLWPLGLTSGLLLLLVWLNVQATLLGYKAAAAREAIDKLKAHNAYLRLELDQAQSPAQLEKEAAKRLGMQRPDPAQMVVMNPDAAPVIASGGPSAPLRFAWSLGNKIRRVL